jgi:hypothetical protein
MLWSLLWLFLWHSLIWVCFALYLITAVCTSRGLWRGCYNQGRLVTMEAKFWTSYVYRQVYLVLKLSIRLLSPDTCLRLGILDWNKQMQFRYNEITGLTLHWFCKLCIASILCTCSVTEIILDFCHFHDFRIVEVGINPVLAMWTTYCTHLSQRL